MAAKREVAFYPVTESLTPDFDFLSTHIAPNEAVVAVRYFGFDCGVKALAEFCRQRQAILIEDLAHAAGASELYGDVGVTSLIKFYPVKLGGQVLVPKYSPLANKLACQSDKLPSYTSVMWKSFAKKVIAKFIPERPKQFRYFNQAQCSKTIDQESEQLISNINRQVLMQRRQKNYRFIVDGIKSSTLGAPLFDELPDDVCPYVVPFLLHDELSFNYIRKNGIQVYRWEEVADLGCELSMKFRHRLVQLPCHQDLTQLQLQTVVDVLMGQSHE